MKIKVTPNDGLPTEADTYRFGTDRRTIVPRRVDVPVEGLVMEFNGDVTVEEVDDRKFIQVVLLTNSGVAPAQKFTYEDPSGVISAGDLVEVPFGTSDTPRVARVVERTEAPPFVAKKILRWFQAVEA
jgi:hypothetical protein